MYVNESIIVGMILAGYIIIQLIKGYFVFIISMMYEGKKEKADPKRNRAQIIDKQIVYKNSEKVYIYILELGDGTRVEVEQVGGAPLIVSDTGTATYQGKTLREFVIAEISEN